MPYALQTSKFGIPVPVAGQVLEASEQLKTYSIIDNQLQAGSYGISRGVYEDGIYTLSLVSAGNYSVYLNGSGASVALRGVVGGGFIESTSTVIWSNLLSGFTWYLTANYTANIYADKTAFTISASTTAPDLASKTTLYLAKVDYTGATPTIDTKPVGKLYISDIFNHMVDFDNPHEVTPAQVGNSTAQWNAYQLYNRTLASSATSAHIGYGYVYDGSQFALQLVGNVSVTGGSVTINHIPQFSDSTGYRMKDGLAVSLSVSSTGTNSSIPTELAVYNAVSGSVVGPVSAVDGNIVLFDGVTGKILKDGLTAVGSIGVSGSALNIPTEVATRNAVNQRPITMITDSDYTATPYDYTILFSTGATNRTCNLPLSSSSTGLVLNIKKIDSGIGEVVVDADGAETIDGNATKNIVNQWDTITIQNNGSNWFIL